MANESIELYKPWTPEKMVFPAGVSEKLDGVPVRIRRIGSHVFAWSRQNEVITSIPHIMQYAERMLMSDGSIVGELYVDGMPFKQISGLVRTKVPTAECGKLVLHVFDFDLAGEPETPYVDRRAVFFAAWSMILASQNIDPATCPVRPVPHAVVHDAGQAEQIYRAIRTVKPKAEGVVVASLSKQFQPGKRLWTTQKIKPKPTLDLKVTSFEEAVSLKTGAGLGRVGRINCAYNVYKKGRLKNDTTGVGPGKLSHAEAEEVWRNQDKYIGRICEVEYMEDDSYDGLRQPTFQRWRDDKSEPDEHLEPA